MTEKSKEQHGSEPIRVKQQAGRDFFWSSDCVFFSTSSAVSGRLYLSFIAMPCRQSLSPPSPPYFLSFSLSLPPSLPPPSSPSAAEESSLILHQKEERKQEISGCERGKEKERDRGEKRRGKEREEMGRTLGLNLRAGMGMCVLCVHAMHFASVSICMQVIEGQKEREGA